MARGWTPQEDELLLRLRDEGLTAREIALRLERSAGAIRMRASLLAEDKQKRWTEADKQLVFQLKSEGHTNKFIAIKLGRTASSISTFVSRNWHVEQASTDARKNNS